MENQQLWPAPSAACAALEAAIGSIIAAHTCSGRRVALRFYWVETTAAGQISIFVTDNLSEVYRKARIDADVDVITIFLSSFGNLHFHTNERPVEHDECPTVARV